MHSSAVEKLFQLPEMTDPRALTVCRFAEPLISATFARSTVWLEQFVHFYLQLFSKFGNPPVASFIYIAYAVQLISQVEELEQGCRIGRMALELAERQGASKILYIVRFVYYAFIHHWLAPAREGVVPLEENVQPAFESGNPRYAISSQDIGVKNSLFVGYKLEQVRAKYKAERLRLDNRDLFPSSVFSIRHQRRKVRTRPDFAGQSSAQWLGLGIQQSAYD
jgi:predicted ATPase